MSSRDLEKNRAQCKSWYWRNRERELRRGRERMAKRRAENPEAIKASIVRCAKKRVLTPKGKAAVLYGACRRRAEQKGIPFTLTKEWLQEKLSGSCEATGLPFIFPEHKAGRGPLSPSVDRIDPEKGYTPENCRVIVWALNCAISTWGEEMLLIVIDSWRSRR